MTYRFEPMTEELLWEFLSNIREQDLREVEAGGHTLAVLSDSLTGLLEDTTAPEEFIALLTESGKLMAVGGIHPLREKLVGAPWFLCTNHAKANPKALLKGVREKAELWSQLYPYQTNKMWAMNTLHASLIKRLGYTIEPTVDERGFATFHKGELPDV